MKKYYLEKIEISEKEEILNTWEEEYFDTLEEAYNALRECEAYTDDDGTKYRYLLNEKLDNDYWEAVYELREDKDFGWEEMSAIAGELNVSIECEAIRYYDTLYNTSEVVERIKEESYEFLTDELFKQTNCNTFDEYNIKKELKEITYDIATIEVPITFFKKLLVECQNAQNGLEKFSYDLNDSDDCEIHIDKIINEINKCLKKAKVAIDYDNYVDRELCEALEEAKDNYEGKL